MRRYQGHLLLIGILALVLVSTAWSGARSSEVQPEAAIRPGEAAANEVLKGNMRVVGELRRQRSELLKTLIDGLRNRQEPLNRDFEGSTYATAITLSDFRSENAVFVLAERIELRLDDASMPFGGDLLPEARYPMVSALVRIGDITVMKTMLQNIRRREEARARELSLWVLHRLVGEELARTLIQAELANARAGSAASDRLAQALENLDRVETFIFPPEQRPEIR